MSDPAPKIQYLNTDLDLVAESDLAPLARALESRGVFPLSVTRGDDGLWYSRLEVNICGESDEPETTLRTMLDAIEALDRDVKNQWDKCQQREFNIGYDCGDEPWAFNNGLSNSTLSRIASLGATLRITLYPYRADAEGASGARCSAPEPGE